MNPDNSQHSQYLTVGNISPSPLRTSEARLTIWEGAEDRPATSPAPSTPSAASVRAERERQAEEARIEDALDAYGDSDPGTDGDLISFEKEVPSKGDPEETITLRYAFIRSGGLYYGTGRTAPQGITYERLTAWLIDYGIAIEDVSAYSVDDSYVTLDEWV